MKVDKSKWEVKKLGEVCSFFTDGNWIESKDQSNFGVRLIQTGNIGIGVYKDKSGKEHFITEKTFKRLDCTEVKEGDCLISRLPDPIGRSCIIPKIKTKCITAVDCSIIRFLPFYIPNFFVLYTQSNSYKIRIQKKVNGTTRKRISRSNLSEILVPVPPLPEQQSIALELDAIQSLITKYKEQLNDYDNLAKSIFNEMFGDVVSNDRGWDRKELGDMCSEVTSSKRIFAKEYVRKGIPFYRSKEIIERSKGLKPSTELFISTERYNEIKKQYGIPHKNDILISAVGTIGEIWVVDIEEPFYFKDGNLIWIKTDGINSSIFLKYLLRILIAEYKKSMPNGAAYSALTINKLQNMIVYEIPLPLQQKFTTRIEAIETMKGLLMQQITDLQTLFDSRMQYYFD